MTLQQFKARLLKAIYEEFIMPTPKGGEGEQDFVSRCMANDVMNSDYPDQKQRAAVCYSQYRRKKSSKK